MQLPEKSILVVEDYLPYQVQFAQYLFNILGMRGNTRINFISSAIDAHCVLFGSQFKPSVIILDHDLQLGNGCELLKAMKDNGLKIPIITASGIPLNNDAMMKLGATYKFMKADVINGKATDIILKHLNEDENITGWETNI